MYLKLCLPIGEHLPYFLYVNRFLQEYVSCEAHASSKVLSALNHQETMRIMHTARSALTNRKGSAYFDLQLQPVASSRHKPFNTGNAVEFDGIPASSNTSFLNVAIGTLGEAAKVNST